MFYLRFLLESYAHVQKKKKKEQKKNRYLSKGQVLNTQVDQELRLIENGVHDIGDFHPWVKHRIYFMRPFCILPNKGAGHESKVVHKNRTPYFRDDRFAYQGWFT